MEQKIQTTLTKPAKLKYEHEIGTTVRVVDIYTDEKGEGIFLLPLKLMVYILKELKSFAKRHPLKENKFFKVRSL